MIAEMIVSPKKTLPRKVKIPGRDFTYNAARLAAFNFIAFRLVKIWTSVSGRKH